MADRAFEKDMQEAGQKKAKADRAASQEKGSKKAAEKKGKADEKETKASEAEDNEIKECAIDGSECRTKDGKCHKTTPSGPYMADDLVSCSKTKPAEEEDAGLSWAGIEPPQPDESCPKPSAACKAAAKACDGNKQCAAAKKLGGTKGIVNVGCHGGRPASTPSSRGRRTAATLTTLASATTFPCSRCRSLPCPCTPTPALTVASRRTVALGPFAPW